MPPPLCARRPLIAAPRPRRPDRRGSALGAFLAGVAALGCARAHPPEVPAPWRPVLAAPPYGMARAPALAIPPVAPPALDPAVGAALAAPPAESVPSPPAATDARSPSPSRYTLLPGVALSPLVQQKVTQIAQAYFRRTGKELTVTSGTRNAAQQAEAMHELLRLGADVTSLYRNKEAIHEILQTYEQGRVAARPAGAVVSAMTEVIQRQIARGIFISMHLRSGAVDIRNRDMTASDKRSFLEAVAEVGGVTTLEETRPPHYHLQVDGSSSAD